MAPDIDRATSNLPVLQVKWTGLTVLEYFIQDLEGGFFRSSATYSICHFLACSAEILSSNPWAAALEPACTGSSEPQIGTCQQFGLNFTTGFSTS